MLKCVEHPRFLLRIHVTQQHAVATRIGTSESRMAPEAFCIT
jgi:hypothetical protein